MTTIRSAPGGGTAVRWAYGVFLALCVALAVLVHHETPAVSATSARPMPSAAHAVHASHAARAVHTFHGLQGATTAPSVSDTSPHNADGGGCAMPGTQHCTTASVDTVQLAVPGRTAFAPRADLRHDPAGHAPGAAVGRAPPDLSVLSQLRI
ncbi:hypothetical protein [Streptomyces sp. NPDC046862]|uniref:hypothetical protein n=1 Tax=Streptomyces sp. NPDC046862 TaxID=3154603 RepID=UPI0034573383